MKKLRSTRAIICIFSFALSISPAVAGIITLPQGLTPGASYRLAFITHAVRADQSTDIEYYNSIAATEAGAVTDLSALGTTWKVIGSTATVNAIDNVGIMAGIPIYDLSGNLVASDASRNSGGLFSSSAIAHIIGTAVNGAQGALYA